MLKYTEGELNLMTAEEALTRTMERKKEIQREADEYWRKELPLWVEAKIELGSSSFTIPLSMRLPSEELLEDLLTLGYRVSKLPESVIISWGA